jgi:hypothetical protein
MKRQIQRLLGLTALALGLGLGFSAPALANYTGSCAGVPSGSQSGNAIIGTAGTACTIPVGGATFTGTITINGSTITTTGAIAAGGALTVNGTSTVNMKALTGSSVAVNTNANITTTTINSSSSLNVATTAGTVTTGALTGAGTGDLVITGTGNVKTAAVVSGGKINITSSGGTVTTTSLTSGNSGDIVIMSNGDLQTGAVKSGISFGATSTTGLIKVTSTITTNIGANGGNVLLKANGNISSGAISTSGTARVGAVEIDANMGGASTVFTIGQSTANGVVSINTSTTTGGGTANNFVGGGLFITNGTASSTGGITVTSSAAINVAASASRSGLIFLNAQNGTITLPAASQALRSDGAAGQGAGQIALLANAVTTASGTVVSASQASGVAGTSHGVVIAANTINLAGTGMQVLGNGDGITGQSGSAFAAIVPKGAATITSTGVLNNLIWNLTIAGPYNQPVTVQGAGAAFTVSANGSNATTSLLAYPLTMTNGATTITSKGSTNHLVAIQNSGTLTGTSGLALTGSGAVLIDASGLASGDLAGAVSLYVDKANITVPSFTIQANAAGSSGFGGNISFQSSALTLGSGTTSKMQANGPTGSGNGGSITVFPGNMATALKLGTNAGDLQVIANGGTTGGDGGTIDVNPFPGDILIDTLNAVSATVLGSSGNGGNVTLIGNPNVTVNNLLTGATINVDGKGTGNAGKIVILGQSTLNVGTGVGALSLSAQATGTGNGGSIELGFLSNLHVDSMSVSAITGTSGNGTGGTINVHDIGQLTVTGTVLANGAGTGKAGTITLGQTALTPMTLTGSTISASGDPAGTGDGNQVTISNAGIITLDNATIDAQGGQAGAGGKGGKITINITGASSTPADISLAHINANALSTGSLDGGTVTINKVAAASGDNAIDPLASINVKSGNSAGTGVIGGTIVLNGTTCARQNTGYTTWPVSYWKCTNPASGQDTIPAAFGNTYLGNLKTQLSSHFVELFVFTQNSAFTSFFNATLTQELAGVTFNVTTGNTIYVNLFETGLTDTNLNEVTGHESGHAAEKTYGSANESASTTYLNFVQNDFLNLDYSAVGTSDATSTRRDPCSPATGASKAPFAGLVDSSTGAQFCGTGLGYTLIPGTSQGIENKYIPGGVLMRNSKILQTADNYTFTQNREIYAQAFTFRAYLTVAGISPTDYQAQTADGILNNSYFLCSSQWANNVAKVTLPHSAGAGSCANAVPSWYPPLIGQ